MIHDIIQAPDPRLLQPSRPVALYSPVGEIIGDLISTRLAANAAGLAAVQIGVHLRIVAVSPKSFYGFKALVNPEIVARSERMVTTEEGCMSVGRGVPRFSMKRHEFVQVHFLDRNGQPHELRADGFASWLVQHEIDHLDGKMIG